MALLDETTPNDLDLLKYHAAYIRELKAKCNELEGLITGTLLFVSQWISALAYAMTKYDVFILADAAAGEQLIILPNPAELTVGVEYKIKKVDTTGNKVVLQAYGATKIDLASTLDITLPNEVVTFVTDGTNLWTT